MHGDITVKQLQKFYDNFRSLNRRQNSQVLGLSSAATKKAVVKKREVTSKIENAIHAIINRPIVNIHDALPSLSALIKGFSADAITKSAIEYVSFSTVFWHSKKTESQTLKLVRELSQALSPDSQDFA